MHPNVVHLPIFAYLYRAIVDRQPWISARRVGRSRAKARPFSIMLATIILKRVSFLVGGPVTGGSFIQFHRRHPYSLLLFLGRVDEFDQAQACGETYD
jgi:hypothetical protein